MELITATGIFVSQAQLVYEILVKLFEISYMYIKGRKAFMQKFILQSESHFCPVLVKPRGDIGFLAVCPSVYLSVRLLCVRPLGFRTFPVIL